MRFRLISTLISALALLLFSVAGVGQDKLLIKVVMLGVDEKPYLPLSLIDLPVKDPAMPGAVMAVNENNQTGLFTDQQFEFEHHLISADNSLSQRVDDSLNQQIGLFVADLPMAQLLELSDLVGDKGLVFNVRAEDDELRNEICRKNIFHLTPSRSMKTDALTQYLIWKRWDEWLVIVGKHPQDKAYFSALERSANRFNADIVETKQWTFDAGSRRTDSGHALAQQEVPVGTRGPKHQVLLVADEADEFGEYLQYRTD